MSRIHSRVEFFTRLKPMNLKLKSIIGVGIVIGSLACSADNRRPATKPQGKAAPQIKCEHVRGAFDVGSSSTKAAVYRINVCTQQILEKIWPTKETPEADSRAELNFAADLLESRKDPTADPKYNPLFSSKMLKMAEDEFIRLKKNMEPFKPESYIAVATQAFRESRNTEDIVTYRLSGKLGIRTLVPLQEEEALLEWVGATTAQNVKDVSTVVTWGIGGGSMQIGTRDNDGKMTPPFTSALASTNMLDAAYQGLQRNGKNFLPVSASEIDQMVAFAQKEGDRASTFIKDKVTGFGVGVLGVGGVINKSVKYFLINNKIIPENAKYFTTDHLKAAMDLMNNKAANDPIFSKVKPDLVNQTVTNFALVRGVMNGVGINAVFFSDIDNTNAAVFARELGLNMKLRVIDDKTDFRPPVAPWQTASTEIRADRPAEAAAPGQPAPPPPPPPPAPVVQVTAENSHVVDEGPDENAVICEDFTLPIKTEGGQRVCVVPVSFMSCVKLCPVPVETNGSCRIPGKTILVYEGGVCKN